MNFLTNKIKIVFILTLCCGRGLAFPLIGEKPAHIVVGKEEAPVVYVALDMFNADMLLVSGNQNAVSDQPAADNIILIGTLGKNKLLDQLITKKQVSVDRIKGQWEAFQIQVVSIEGKKILTVMGSDARGTAYGILELSRLIGVSPWVWWADCLPETKTSLTLPDDFFMKQQPSVQYRGIFINDEDLGFMPWSTKTIDKTSVKGASGPIAYEKVYQLLLRLRANTIWPAMHECTVPFYQVEGNKEMADTYGIMVGSSHCDPLLRTSGSEWNKTKYGDYNYLTNKKAITEYWIERLKEVHTFESLYTIGLRGMHDVAMEGVNTLNEKTAALNQVIRDQRSLLRKYVNKDLKSIPQIFVPYKEVLPVYENKLNVPDDIALMWCDDNYGYMTRLSNGEEQKRSGGSGVYYHISYWGRPHPYTWLSSTSPALVYWQMKQAWDYDARKIWILNVGDIKPAEYEMEFFLNMAWNIEKVNESNIYEIQQNWLSREFGEQLSPRIHAIRNAYYRLAHIRKPEYMGWSRVEEFQAGGGKTKVLDTELNPYLFGDEIHMRLKAYSDMARETAEIAQSIPLQKQDAYYQLVQFPLDATLEMNKKLLYAQKARLYARYDLPVANEYAQKSLMAFHTIDSITTYYNESMSNGKWKGMMHNRSWGTAVYQEPDLPDEVKQRRTNEVMIWPENYSKPFGVEKKIKLTPFVIPSGEKTFISIFSRDGLAPSWEITDKPDWLHIEEEKLDLIAEKRIHFSVSMDKLGSGIEKGTCVLTVNNRPYTFMVEATNPIKDMPVEYNRMVVIHTQEYQTHGSAPIAIQGLGYSSRALQLPIGKENAVSYTFYSVSSGDMHINAYMLPNHPIDGGDIRYAISIDGGEPQIVSIDSDFRNRDEQWKVNVLRNQSITTTWHELAAPGEHTLTIYALDKGIILDQLAVDFQTDRHFYSIPTFSGRSYTPLEQNDYEDSYNK